MAKKIIDQRDKKIRKLRNQLFDIGIELSNLETSKAALADQLISASERLEHLTQENTTLHSQVQTLQTQLEACRNNCENAKIQIGKKDAVTAELRSMVVEAMKGKS